AGDINNDGLPDLFFSGGHENSGLFLNKGNFKFENITRSAGIIDYGEKYFDTEGVNFVDINGDGLLDIYVLKTGLTGNFSTRQFNKDGANLLFINQGDLTFQEEAAKYGLDIIGLSHTANFFDYDGDGDLDVYMAQTAETGASFSFPYYDKPPRVKWLNDQFLENQDGRFVDVRDQVGLPYERNIALSVAVGDVNNDGFGDIYVANDFFGRDFFFLNNGDKTFRDAHKEYFHQAPMSAMGSDFADFNNDGWQDLFVGEMMPPGNTRQKQNLVPFSLDIYNKLEATQRPQYPRNMLQLNRIGQAFSDIGLFANVHATEWSWSAFFFDADLDGWKDLYVANGILRDMTNMDFVKKNFGEDYTLMADPEFKAKAKNTEAPRVVTPNFCFTNKNGLEFGDVTQDWELDQPLQTRGATYADLDNDGDLDLILNIMDDSPVLYRNTARENDIGHYLKLKLKGQGQNTFGIGASVEVSQNGQTQSHYLSGQRGFQSSPEPIIHFGFQNEEPIDSLIITWPGGGKELYTSIEVDQTLELIQGEGQDYTDADETPSTIFSLIDLPPLMHRENDYQDFKSERLAIKLNSNLGPGLSSGDLDGNGQADLVLGSSKGYSMQALMNGQSVRDFQPGGMGSNGEPLSSLILDANGDGNDDILVCNGPDDGTLGPPYDQLYLNDGKGNFRISDVWPQIRSNSRQAISSDFDGDGDQDLLLIGRRDKTTKGKARNYLLRNDNNSFKDVTDDLLSELHTTLPLSCATWTDMDGDGDDDLIVVGHWHPVTIHINEGDSFSKKTINQSTGWWNSVVTADIDNDGDMDLLTGNHGLNSIFKASKDKPLTLAIADYDQNGSWDPLVFRYINGVNAPFVNKDLFTSHMPFFNKRYYSFKAYSEATYEELVVDSLDPEIHKATQLASGVWINEPKLNFKFIPFPNKAQLAPIHDILSRDFTGDGLPDLIIAGNSNSIHYEYGNINALGIALLEGTGDGNFKFINPGRSGLFTTGYPRDIELWEKDSKLIISVSQNNGEVVNYSIEKPLN
ncbi:MAG: VCBS repeat-containing protein, partial [Saprospiraceae bacterium]|nr:VCBS repeat-containing protein [Saprospiraceae bacterium]